MRIRLILQSMLYRRGNIAGSLVAQTLAVAVMFATLLLGYSSAQGPGVTWKYGDADAVVRVSPARLLGVASDMAPEAFAFRMPQAALDDLAAIPGVATVVPDRTFAAQALDAAGEPVIVSGHDLSVGQAWSVADLTPFALVDGSPPEGSGDIVLDRATADAGGFGIGDRVTIVTNAGAEPFRVAGIAVPAEGDALRRQASLFFHDETADRIAPPSQGTGVAGIIYADDVDPEIVTDEIGVVAKAHSLDVLTGPDRGRADVTAGQGELKDLGIVFLFMGMFIGFVSIFVISSTFSFSITQRTREIAVQRAIGFTPGQIRRAISIEAAVIGVTGAGLGVGLGTLGAAAFIAMMRLAGRAPEEFSVHFWKPGVWMVLVASIIISQLAVFLAARRAAKVRPTIALRESSAIQRWFQPIRTVAGFAFVAGAVACLWIAPSAGTEGAIGLSFMVTVCATVGIAMLAPVLVYLGTSVVDRLVGRRSRATTRVAIRNSRARSARVGSAMGVIVLSLGFATLIACFNATLEAGVTESTHRTLQADIFVVPDAGVLPPGIDASIERIEGVGAVSAAYDFVGLNRSRIEEGMVEAEDVYARAVNPAAMPHIVEVDFAEGSWESLVPGTVLVTAELASWHGLQINDRWAITMPDMSDVDVGIAGIIEQPLANAEVIFTDDDALPHLVDPSITELLVTIEPGASVDAVVERIEKEGAAPMAVVDKDAYVSGLNAGLRENAWAGNLIIGGAAAFAGIAAINTIVMSTWERGREFSLMRLIGSLERQVLQMVNAESLLVGVSASAIGIGIGILSATAVSVGLVGDASALTVPIPLVGVYGIIAIVVVIVSAAVPARTKVHDASPAAAQDAG